LQSKDHKGITQTQATQATQAQAQAQTQAQAQSTKHKHKLQIMLTKVLCKLHNAVGKRARLLLSLFGTAVQLLEEAHC
tara:strand:+ start:314 stop:547 length:234 start_codon:yes stop_codon:yes gene_type:complete